MKSPFPSALLCALLCGGCSSPFTVSEKMMWSTYPLATRQGTGTGFVVTHHDPDEPGGIVPVIFTSAHVLDTVGNGKLSLAIRLPDEGGQVHALPIVFQPSALRKDGSKFYVRHPSCDLAAFALRLPEEVADLIPLPSFLDERTLSASGPALHTGDEVAFLGFPDVLPAMEGAFPLLRSGRVASYPASGPGSDGIFLIDSDVHPGDSGAPVFLCSRTGRPRLVGSITSRVVANSNTSSHVALAVNAEVIRDTMALLLESESQARAERTAASSSLHP